MSAISAISAMSAICISEMTSLDSRESNTYIYISDSRVFSPNYMFSQKTNKNRVLRILDDNRETNHLEQEIVVFADYGLS